MEQEFILDKEKVFFDVEISSDKCKSEIDGNTYELDFRLLGSNRLSLIGKSGVHACYFAKDKDTIYVFIKGEKYTFKIPESGSDFGDIAAGAGAGGGLVETPMPGTIIKFLVGEGDEVEIDQGLVIVEAMKMENEIRSNIKARVKKINFKPGDAVDMGQSIIDLEAITEEE